MKSDLVRYAKREVSVPRADRSVATQAKGVFDETRLAAMKSDASLALGAHMMTGFKELHQLAQTLAGGDPALQMVLGVIEAETINQLGRIQRNLFNDWGF